MSKIKEDKLEFLFDFDAIKLDDTNYYRNKFQKVQNNLKVIDILAINAKKNYFIEIKDYTYPNTKSIKQIELIEAIIKKVVCSLSMLYPMSYKALDINEKSIAKLFFNKKELTVVLHIEKPPLTTKLEQSKWDLSDLQSKLRQRLKYIADSVKVVSIKKMQKLPWNVMIKAENKKEKK
jgi:hypothetical protein